MFPGGGGIELVRDSGGKSSLLLLKDGKCKIYRKIETDGQIFVPSEIRPTVFRAVTWPSDCRPYRSTHALFREVFDLISRTTGLAESPATLTVFFVLATWFVDVLPVAPMLWAVVPPVASNATLRQVLRLLCRRALPIGEFSMATLRSLPTELRPTILTEVSVVTPRLIRALQVSRRPNTYTPVANGLSDLYCSKAIFADQPLHDRPAAGFPLELVLAPSKAYIAAVSLEDQARASSDLVPKLLMYRLQNHARVTTTTPEISGLTSSVQEVARTLAACIVGDDELQSRVAPLLQVQDAEIRADLKSLLESITLEALMTKYRDLTDTILPIVDLTQAVNTILEGRGDSRAVSPESVGWALSRLELCREDMPDGRRGLRLSKQTRAKIQHLAAVYGLGLGP